MTLIQTDQVAIRMRDRIIRPQQKSIQLSRLAGSDQESDLQVPPNCGGLGRIRHFKTATSNGWPSNPLPILPACHVLGLPPLDALNAQVFQNNACAWRCWYCFVPYKLLAGDPTQGEWITAKDLVDLYLAELDRPLVIDLSGGSPDLTPEWVVWMMEALEEAGLSESVYLWSDDNLSTDYVFSRLSDEQRHKMAAYPSYGRVCCFKGFDSASFTFNTKASPDAFDEQFVIFKRLLNLGIDLYAYTTFTGPDPSAVANAMPAFIDRLQLIDENLPLRTIPLEISAFGPMQARVEADRRIPASIALQTQTLAIGAWTKELYKRFSPDLLSRPINEIRIG